MKYALILFIIKSFVDISQIKFCYFANKWNYRKLFMSQLDYTYQHKNDFNETSSNVMDENHK